MADPNDLLQDAKKDGLMSQIIRRIGELEKWARQHKAYQHNRVAVDIAAATAKSTPVDADKVGIWDSVTGLLNSVTWANIKTTLSSIFPPNYVDKTAWTPVVAGTATAGVATYTTQDGTYSRIGNIAFITCSLVWTAHTGTGNMKITGLPIISATNANQFYTPISVEWSNVTLLAIGNKIMPVVLNNSTQIDLFEIGSGAASALPLDTAATLRLAGFYFV